jgi:leader peptidase (prepilin peptidase)/N-methyltransferase
MELIVVLVGLSVGSIINMLADSLPQNRRVMLPRCQGCTAPRPLPAWLGVGALISKTWRCAYCDRAISWRAPLIELAMATGALWLYLRNPDPFTLFIDGLVLVFFLLVVVIDIEHRLILHVVTGPAALIFSLIGFYKPDMGLKLTLLGGLFGFGLFLAFYLMGLVFARLIARLRGKVLDEIALGFGDVTLSGVLGLMLGFQGTGSRIIVALFIAVLAAGEFSFVYLLFMAIRRRYQPFLPIPYGPFLLMGAAIVYFGGRTVVESLFPSGPIYLLVVLIIYFSIRTGIEFIQTNK